MQVRDGGEERCRDEAKRDPHVSRLAAFVRFDTGSEAQNSEGPPRGGPSSISNATNCPVHILVWLTSIVGKRLRRSAARHDLDFQPTIA